MFRDEETTADLRAAVDVVERQKDRPALDAACQELLKIVRSRCPGLLPTEPLPPGRPAEPVPADPKQAQNLIALAARQAVLTAGGARLPATDEELPTVVLWQAGPDQLLVEVGALRVDVAPGMVTVSVPVRCNEIPRQRALVGVTFTVGTAERPAGLLAATSEPDGPAVVVRRWGDALMALAWQAVLDSAGALAAATGADEDGNPLVPVALTAGREGLAVLPQARHPVDRMRAGLVVRQ